MGFNGKMEAVHLSRGAITEAYNALIKVYRLLVIMLPILKLTLSILM